MDSFNYKVHSPSNYDGLADPDIAKPLRIKTKTPPPKEASTVASTLIIPQNTVKVVKPPATDCTDNTNILAQLNNLYSEIGKNNSELSEMKSLVSNFKLIFELLTNKSFIYSVSVPIYTWTIEHNKKSISLVYFLVDSDGVEIYPDEVRILDGNTIEIKFTAPQAGTVNLLFF